MIDRMARGSPVGSPLRPRFAAVPPPDDRRGPPHLATGRADAPPAARLLARVDPYAIGIRAQLFAPCLPAAGWWLFACPATGQAGARLPLPRHPLAPACAPALVVPGGLRPLSPARLALWGHAAGAPPLYLRSGPPRLIRACRGAALALCGRVHPSALGRRRARARPRALRPGAAPRASARPRGAARRPASWPLHQVGPVRLPPTVGRQRGLARQRSASTPPLRGWLPRASRALAAPRPGVGGGSRPLPGPAVPAAAAVGRQSVTHRGCVHGVVALSGRGVAGRLARWLAGVWVLAASLSVPRALAARRSVGPRLGGRCRRGGPRRPRCTALSPASPRHSSPSPRLALSQREQPPDAEAFEA